MKCELTPIFDSAKSFYGKATIDRQIDHNGIVTETLISYTTPVLQVTYDGDPKVERLWDGYSVTTMRHINEYLTQNGFTQGGKSWWCSLQVTK